MSTISFVDEDGKTKKVVTEKVGTRLPVTLSEESFLQDRELVGLIKDLLDEIRLTNKYLAEMLGDEICK